MVNNEASKILRNDYIRMNATSASIEDLIKTTKLYKDDMSLIDEVKN
jgi:hypothetical protein